MLRFNRANTNSMVGNIKYRNTYLVGEVTADKGNGRYDVIIAGEDQPYPNIFTIEKQPDYVVGDKVGILYEYGIKEKPVICGVLRTIQESGITGVVNSLGV